jgi:hypothetical protein
MIGTEIRGLHQGQANRRHQQAGYMEAPDQVAQQVYFPLLSEGRPYMELFTCPLQIHNVRR